MSPRHRGEGEVESMRRTAVVPELGVAAPPSTRGVENLPGRSAISQFNQNGREQNNHTPALCRAKQWECPPPPLPTQAIREHCLRESKERIKFSKSQVVLLACFVGNVERDNRLLPTKICCRVCGWGILPHAHLSREKCSRLRNPRVSI